MPFFATTDDPREHIRRWIPKRPYATNNLSEGIWHQNKRFALEARYLQPNADFIWYLPFDCDHDGTYSAAQDGLLPLPNVVVLNDNNGRGHIGYLLETPIWQADAARIRPLQYLAKIQIGLTRRLDADPAFAGLMTKNPFHPVWRTTFLHGYLYELSELDEHLHSANCIKPRSIEQSGLGRNCLLFDEVRHLAYRKVRDFKLNGEPKSIFDAWTFQQTTILNAQFSVPLHESAHSDVSGHLFR